MVGVAVVGTDNNGWKEGRSTFLSGTRRQKAGQGDWARRLGCEDAMQIGTID
jgi:hypothetical protein